MKIETTENSILFEIPSVVVLIEPLIARCLTVLHSFSLTEASIRNISLVLRELLNNAVNHGNKNDMQLVVRGAVKRIGRDSLVITVEDEGSGFDYRSLDTRLPENPLYLARRGYILIYSLAKRVTFNEDGNRVVVEFALEENSGTRLAACAEGKEDSMPREHGELQETVASYLDMMYSIAIHLVKHEEGAKQLVEQAAQAVLSPGFDRQLPLKSHLLFQLREAYKGSQ